MDKENSLPEQLSRDFTKMTLGNHNPDHMCFTISFPLSLHLDNNAIKNTLRIGTFYGGEPSKEGVQHFWIMLDGEKENIIDPTAKQFYRDMKEAILLGPKPKNYCEHFEPSKEWFQHHYETWAKKLLKHDEEEELKKKQRLDIKVLLDINLRAAIILNSECEKMNIIPSVLYKKYFACIYRVIQKYHDKDELTQLSLPDEFQSLLKKALSKSSGHRK